MNEKPLRATIERIQKTAIRGRSHDGSEVFEIGATGVSVVHGYTQALQKRAVLLCAVGPHGEASDILPYDLMPSNNALREKIGVAVRNLVARVEGAQATGTEMLQ